MFGFLNVDFFFSAFVGRAVNRNRLIDIESGGICTRSFCDICVRTIVLRCFTGSVMSSLKKTVRANSSNQLIKGWNQKQVHLLHMDLKKQVQPTSKKSHLASHVIGQKNAVPVYARVIKLTLGWVIDRSYTPVAQQVAPSHQPKRKKHREKALKKRREWGIWTQASDLQNRAPYRYKNKAGNIFICTLQPGSIVSPQICSSSNHHADFWR